MLFSSIPDLSSHMSWSFCEARYNHVHLGLCRTTIHSKIIFTGLTSDWSMALAIGTSAETKRGKNTANLESCSLPRTPWRATVSRYQMH
jgi:hypothetical protein